MDDIDLTGEWLRGLLGTCALAALSRGSAHGYAVVQQLQAAAQEDDQEKLRALAHSLKSSSANVGAMALSSAARRIELEARNGTLQMPVVAAARVVAEFARARIALAGWQRR